MLILYIVLGVLFVSYLLVLAYVSFKVIKIDRLSYDEIWKFDKELNNLSDDIRDIPYESFYKINKRGLKLHARLFKAEVLTNKYIFLNHGNSCVYTGMLKYINMYLDMGYNVFAPDHMGRGESEGKYNTYGYYEHQDSLEWLDYLYQLDESAEIGVVGESMGGTISLLMASKDRRIKFVIDDCGFHNAYDSVRYVTAMKIGILSNIVTPLVNLMIFLVTRANIKKVDVLSIIDKIMVPVLIIHGMKDVKVLPESSFLIHDANPDNELEIFSEGQHAQCFSADNEKYKSIISSFLERKGF